MKKGKLVLYFVVLIIILVLIFVGFNSINLTGNVLLEFEKDFKVGEKLTGPLTLTIEKGDSLSKDTPILLSLIKGNEVLRVETLTLEEFVTKSSSQGVFKKSQEYVYEENTVHVVDIGRVIDYTFEESGNYQLIFSVLSLDLNIRERIKVD